MIQRLSAVIEKESKSILKDKVFLLMILIAPVIALAVFGYSFQQNIDHLPTLIIDQDNSDYSHEVVIATQNSDYFKVLSVNKLSLDESLEMLSNSEVRAVIVIPKDFKNNLDNAIPSTIYINIDSSDYTIYNTLKAAIGGVIKDSLQEISLKIIGKLELEKDKNIQKVNEIKNLTSDIETKMDSMKSGVDDINSKFSDFRQRLDDSKEKIEGLQSDFEKLHKFLVANNISFPISININDLVDFDEYEQLLNENEIEANKLKSDSDELFAKYDIIKGSVDGVDLQFKTLKKEFLTHPLELKDNLIFGEISYFTYLAAGIISMTLFFICVLITSMSIIGEKEKKTLFRLATTPLKKFELISGKFLTFLVLGIFEGVYAILFTIFLFHVGCKGNLIYVFFVLALLAGVSVSIGLLVSVLVRTTRQALIIIPAMISPALLMSQTFAPIEVMPKFMQYIAKLTPNYYSNVALREIMIKGSSLFGIWHEIVILFVFMIVFLALGIILLKKRIS
jgi:ABC-2 type transport system permease protein